MVSNSGDAGEGGAGQCSSGEVLPGEVVWIGDSWAQNSTLRSGVQAAAQLSGALAQGEDYVNLAMAAESMADVAKQYTTRESGATKVKVLLMDGGTWDPLIAQQTPGASVPDAIDGSTRAFHDFLTTVAADGTVEQIVYFLVPNVASVPGFDAMGDDFETACQGSRVPCYFIDLRPVWAGNSSYTMLGVQPSDKGAQVIAGLVWQTMQEHCIAQ
jgi:hypothetical protein